MYNEIINIDKDGELSQIPNGSLREYSVENIEENTNYSFYIDADSLFIGEMKEEFLPVGGMIGTIHPCLFSGNGTPERNPNSKAFISHSENLMNPFQYNRNNVTHYST